MSYSWKYSNERSFIESAVAANFYNKGKLSLTIPHRLGMQPQAKSAFQLSQVKSLLSITEQTTLWIKWKLKTNISRWHKAGRICASESCMIGFV